MKKTIKKLVMQIKVNTFEVNVKDLPKDFQTYYDKPLMKGKKLSTIRILNTNFNVDSKEVHALLNRIRNDEDFQTFFRRANANPNITHDNLFKTFYEVFPEKILDLCYYRINIDFFTHVFSFLTDKSKFFHPVVMDINYVSSFSETFLEALQKSKISLESFNFFDLKFSTLPNERLTKLLAMTSYKITPENKENTIAQIVAMIDYNRKESVTQILNKTKLTNDTLQPILNNPKISSKYQKLILKYTKKGTQYA